MLANLVKSLNTRCHVRYTYEFTRQLCSLKENIAGRRSAKEEEEALKIEANLFDQSSLKYEPVAAEQILIQNRKQKPFRSDVNRVPSTYKPPVRVVKKTRAEREDQSRVIYDEELGLEYIRLGLNDPRLTTMLITARSKKRRDKDRQIIVEGRRLILEALEGKLQLKSIIFSQKENLAEMKEQVAKALKRNKSSQIYKVPHHDLKTWSTLSTPPGVMAVFERPDVNNTIKRLTNANVQPLPVTVVCDNIREPNNLGSIIRTCAALPCFQIVITKGCCDPWDSKALRGGCGGHFRVPIRDDIDWEDVVLTIPPEMADDCCVFVAENNLKKLQNNFKVVDYTNVADIGAHNVVVIGGESHGVSEQAYR